MTVNSPFDDTFLAQLASVNTRSREFPNTLAKMLGSQEGVNAAMSLQGDDALTLVDILDQAFEAPNMEVDLRRKSIRILRAEGDIGLKASGGFRGALKGHRNGNRVRVKSLRTHTGGGLSKIERGLFREIVIWRRLSHPNVLPVLGVSPKLFPLCTITEWMVHGNITDFTSKHPEVNRLHLLAEASKGLHYLHSIRITHGRLKPENILIDHDRCARLSDYGLPLRLDAVKGGLHCSDDLQYLAPELLDPPGFGLETRIPTKESDIFAFGMVTYQVLAGQQPFSGARYSIIDNIVTGTRPRRPSGSKEWFSDSLWDLVCRCWSTLWDDRPDASLVTNALSDAGDFIEFRRREPGLVAFLDATKAGGKGGLEIKKAQELMDTVDLVLNEGDLTKRTRKQYLKYLRKLCSMFAILPSSFTLAPGLDRRGAAPCNLGGFSDVYMGTLEGRPVVIKTLRTTDPRRLYRLLTREVVGWKWLRHENILPFVGVVFTPPLISIISERMQNGNIMEFVRVYPKHNRLCLLTDAVTGLEYLHEHDIVHGDLKGANILIDSNCRASLADFGLAVVIDESMAGSTANHRGAGGTTRWMAPEMMYPDKFGFADGYRKHLPSRSTDVYALGMTILEVISGCPPFDGIIRDVAVICTVLEGGRPDRPSSGLPDWLWELLVSTWSVEHRSQPSKRPSATTVLDRLREGVHSWGKSITPATLAQLQNRRGNTDTVGSRWEDNSGLTKERIIGPGTDKDEVPENTRTVTGTCQTSFHLPQADPKKMGIAGVVKWLILGFLGRLLGLLESLFEVME